MSFRSAAALGRRFARKGTDVTFCLEPLESRVNRADRKIPSRALINLAADGHSVRVFPEPHEREKDDVFQRTQKLSARHLFYTIEQIGGRDQSRNWEGKPSAYTARMPQDLLSEAREQAERSAPAVKTAALLHLARVLTKVDRAEAEHLLDEGLALAATLPGDDRDILLGEAAALAATVSPQRAFPFARETSADRDSVLTRVLFNMIEHGYVADAVAYLTEPVPGEGYPFDAALQAMGRSSDDEARLRVLRGAIRAMREQQVSEWSTAFSQHRFVRLFTHHWTRLPAEEAREVVRELVGRILSQPDSRTNASFSSGSHRVQFSSTHEQHLFEILGPLRHLDPDLAASVAKNYPQLSAAAERFPYGRESMDLAMHDQRPPIPRAPIEQPDYIDVGRRLIPIPEAIRTEFKDAFAVALDLYAADSDPDNFNDAPQECWPSALEFRKILYKAGQHEGQAAARHLDRIPAPALRLFAQIELAAALAGLPQLGGRTIRPGPRGLRDMMRASRERIPPPASSAVPLVAPPRKPKLPPSRELRISPAAVPAGEGPSGGSGSDFVEIRNVSLKAVVAKLHDMPEVRIDWPSSLDPDARYDFVLVLPRPESREMMTRLMREGIAKHFRVEISSEVRPTDTYVLTAPNGIRARPILEESMFEFGSIGIGAGSTGAIDVGAGAPDGSIGSNHPPIPEALFLEEILNTPSSDIAQSNEEGDEVCRRFRRQLFAPVGRGAWIAGIDASMTLKELCGTIEGGLDRPLLDETNLTGTYAISIDTEATTTADFLRAVCEKLGLVSTSGRSDVRLLVVRAL
jgi:uncharacterized protein (TIGR03435 family)